MAKLRFSIEAWKVNWVKITELDDGHADIKVRGNAISKDYFVKWIPFVSYRTIEKDMESILNGLADDIATKIVTADYSMYVDVEDQAISLLTDDFAFFMRIRNAREKH